MAWQSRVLLRLASNIFLARSRTATWCLLHLANQTPDLCKNLLLSFCPCSCESCLASRSSLLQVSLCQTRVARLFAVPDAVSLSCVPRKAPFWSRRGAQLAHFHKPRSFRAHFLHVRRYRSRLRQAAALICASSFSSPHFWHRLVSLQFRHTRRSDAPLLRHLLWKAVVGCQDLQVQHCHG